MHGEHQWRFDATDERHEIVDRPVLIGKCVGVDLGEGLGADPDILAVGGLVGDELRRAVAVGARFVLDDDGLVERLGHRIGDQARVRIDGAARRRADDQANGVGLRQRRAGGRGQRGAEQDKLH